MLQVTENEKFNSTGKAVQSMTRIGRRLIEDFLLPALNDERYGDLLKWIDKEKSFFSIRWSHKNAAKWSLDDTAVFQDWDKLKGHYHPEQKGYYMQAKQRFRAALYKLSSVRRINCENKHVKIYQLLLDPEKRKIEFMSSPKMKYSKKMIEYCNHNRHSVITKHSSNEEKPKPLYYAPPTSPSPASSEDSDSSDNNEFANCIHDYKVGQKNHNQMMLTNFSCPAIQFRQDSPLREVNEDRNRNGSYLQRTPHLPIQPVPVYNMPSQKRFELESPRLLLVKTYHEDKYFDYEKELYPGFDVSDSFDGCALNLSVKSDDSDVLSR